jgi:hypothetical protein
MMVTSVTKVGTQKLPKNIKTIHWKALEEHFLMAPLVFRLTHLWDKNAFSELFVKKLSP